ncbi:MAG TPA: peptide ABC transporter substrate-binding protein [Woeseiaceae bacterium]|nr:peptide ABC transporter substrate-binding protein [Woeseiaceae bacterium]
MRSPLFLPFAFLCAAGLLAAACEPPAGRGPGSPGDGRSGALKRGNGGDPGTLDPAAAEDVHAFNVLIDLYEGLVVQDADGALVPGAAAVWEVSEDGTRYRFALRKSARWSNGEPLLARHFVDGIRHVAGAGSRSPNAFLLSPLENFAAVSRGELPAERLGIIATGDHSLELKLSQAARYFPSVLSMPIAFPRLIDEHANPKAFTEAAHFVGNGPYLLEEWRIGSHIRLRKNHAFRAASEVSIEAVEYFAVEDPHTEYNLYRTGELDITSTIPPSVLADARQERPDEVRISPALAVYYLAFDLSEPPMSVIEARKALSMAIDRHTLTEVLARGEQAAFNLVPPGVSEHDPAEYSWKGLPRGQREQAARQAYAKAGYSSASPMTVKLTYDAGDVHEQVALIVSSMWEEVLGANVELEKLEWKIFLDTRAQHANWQIMRFAWFGDYDDASTFTDIFRSDSLQNLPGYSSRQYDELLDIAGTQSDPVLRRKLMSSAERVLIDDYPIVPLYFYVNKHLVDPRVEGFLPNALDRHATRTLSLR